MTSAAISSPGSSAVEAMNISLRSLCASTSLPSALHTFPLPCACSCMQHTQLSACTLWGSYQLPSDTYSCEQGTQLTMHNGVFCACSYGDTVHTLVSKHLHTAAVGKLGAAYRGGEQDEAIVAQRIGEPDEQQ